MAAVVASPRSMRAALDAVVRGSALDIVQPNGPSATTEMLPLCTTAVSELAASHIGPEVGEMVIADGAPATSVEHFQPTTAATASPETDAIAFVGRGAGCKTRRALGTRSAANTRDTLRARRALPSWVARGSAGTTRAAFADGAGGTTLTFAPCVPARARLALVPTGAHPTEWTLVSDRSTQTTDAPRTLRSTWPKFSLRTLLAGTTDAALGTNAARRPGGSGFAPAFSRDSINDHRSLLINLLHDDLLNSSHTGQ
mmetsp:Transcript_21347/g.50154  ORF Transcript_21347/g.50154 Transcript_21347/m.50154 type:complete len:256 (-) Transcript_21347:209-976(-)